ncbi:solute carrier family 35 member F6-like isoform X2 [Pomacea canaliculata]|uniref:solute carrier family 35 member F6-like isoform X2 n=1 Tax=Pomacea canaliculata TaxID=400727 RepID=UPI000D725E5F|nr:solute carrier family 35 member F6-like isoform X2 [Pomacea canaliculata]
MSVRVTGECACLVGLLLHRRHEKQKFLKESKWASQIGHEPPTAPENPRLFQWIFIIPTICDLVGTSLAGIGLLYVDASVWQMLRGSIIIFAGILSKIFLKRKLYPVHWLGMLVTMGGLILVGCSSVFQSTQSTSGSKTLLGILLILGSQLVSASQMIIEELFLKKKNFHPLQVVGMEGTFGLLLMTFVVLPVMYFIPGDDPGGRYENSIDALYQLGNSPKLLIFCILYLISIAFYNYFGLAVTKSLTAVHRTLIDACRTILVWAVSLVIYYGFDKEFGEDFDKTYGILQVDGFSFLVIGTMLYNQVMTLPWIPWCNPPPSVEVVAIVNEDHGVNGKRSASVKKSANIQDLEESYKSDIDECSTLLARPKTERQQQVYT